MTAARHSEWLLEERVRARSGSAAVEEYLRGRAQDARNRADFYRSALRNVASAYLSPGHELRAVAEAALQEGEV